MPPKNKTIATECAEEKLVDRKHRNPPTREYRMWNLTWIGLLLVALGIGVFTIFGRAFIPEWLFIPLILLANLFVVAAILINSIKLQRLREDYDRAFATASKSKAARAEQKRLRATRREEEKARAAGIESNPVDESNMTFRERIAYRARKSAEAANIKGSGL